MHDQLLTRNGRVAQSLAVELLRHEPGGRIGRMHDYARQLGVGNGTVQAALRLLGQAGAVDLHARGRLGTFVQNADRARLWQLAGLGTVLAALPLPYSRRYEGIATGLKSAFAEAEVPFGVTFMRGAQARAAALVEGRCEVALMSRLAFDTLADSQPLRVFADFGPGSYVRAHGVVLGAGRELDSGELAVAVDASSVDQQTLTDLVFERRQVRRVMTSYMQLPALFARGEVDATVWALDEVERLLPDTRVVGLDDGALDALGGRNTVAVLVCRAGDDPALEIARDGIDWQVVSSMQRQVLAGGVIPSY